jgi:hypothetical protein
MNIKCVKLMTGEDIIADVHEEDNMVLLNKPCLIMMVPQGNNTYGIALGPFLPWAEDSKVTVKSACVMSLYFPETDLKNEYNSRYGSGIVMPSSSVAPTGFTPTLVK